MRTILRNQRYFFVAVLLLGVGALAFAYTSSSEISSVPLTVADATSTHGIPIPAVPSPLVTIGDVVIPVTIAKGSVAVQKGLSGRASLEASSGMLFVFSKPAIYSFWMPDMRFPIDIVWMNEGKVVGITEDASDDFDPQNPVFYKPPAPARHVLEVNAGFAKRNGIAVGDTVIMSAIE